MLNSELAGSLIGSREWLTPDALERYRCGSWTERMASPFAEWHARWRVLMAPKLAQPAAKRPPAHKNRRRRRYTQELVRCPHVTEKSGRQLPCQALLWYSDLPALQEHLLEHYPGRDFTEQETRDFFTRAKAIHLEGVHTCLKHTCDCDQQ